MAPFFSQLLHVLLRWRRTIFSNSASKESELALEELDEKRDCISVSSIFVSCVRFSSDLLTMADVIDDSEGTI